MKIKYTGETDISLTNGKIYEVLSIKYETYQIVDDNGEEYFFPSEEFEIVSED